MTQRYGGLFSHLSSRDIAIIRNAEQFFLSDPHYPLYENERSDIQDILELYEDDYPGLENLSLDQLEEAIEGLLEQFDQEMINPGKAYSSDFYSYWKTMSPSAKANREVHVGPYRLWASRLRGILAKIKKYKKNLRSGDLD